MAHDALDEGRDAMHPLEAELSELIATDRTMWRFLQAGSLDGVWYWNLERPDEEWMSPEFWQLFGVDPATKRHDPAEWQDIIFQEDLAIACENFERHCADPDHPYDQIVRYRHANGSIVWVRCRGMAIRDEAGTPIRMLGAHNDLTAVKLAEQNALREKRKLEVANDELRSFAYGVSHDLKSPSRTALHLIEEVRRSASSRLTGEEMELLDDARDTLHRMQALVHDLLDYGRVVEERLEVVRLDTAAIVQEVVEDLSAEIRANDARIIIGDLPQVLGHPSQIRMLLQNLISNAVKYRRADVQPVVELAGKKVNGNLAQLWVRDNGCGIDPTHLNSIFNVFTRLHRYDQVPGTGLGLPLCKRIALNHGGSIAAVSTEGEGSTFTVTLPRK